MNWHTGNRPYKCTKCSASYSERSSYYKHIHKEHDTAQRTVQKTVLPLTEPHTILVGEDSTLLDYNNLVTVSQDEGDTFILYTDGTGKQQLIPVRPNSDLDVAICEEVIEVSEEGPAGVKTEVSGIPKVVELRSSTGWMDNKSRSLLTPKHSRPGVITKETPQTSLLQPAAPTNAAVERALVEEPSTTSESTEERPVVTETGTKGLSETDTSIPDPSVQTVMSSDGTQHVELIFTDDNPDLFIKQLEQLTSGQVEVIINEQS